MHHAPDQGEAEQGDDQEATQPAQGGPGGEGDPEPDGQQDERRPQVRLAVDQRHRDGDDEQGEQEGAQALPLPLPAGPEAGQADHQGHLGQLGGLEGEGAEGDPALGAVVRGPRHQDEPQDAHRPGVDEGGQRPDHPVVDEGEPQHQHQPHGGVDALDQELRG